MEQLDSKLRQFCTNDQQRAIFDTCLNASSVREAAKVSEYTLSAMKSSISRLKARAATKGYDPDNGLTNPVAEGQNLKGVSTLYDKDGNIKIQWVKSQEDKDKAESLMRDMFDALGSELSREKPVKAPTTLG